MLRDLKVGADENERASSTTWLCMRRMGAIEGAVPIQAECRAGREGCG